MSKHKVSDAEFIRRKNKILQELGVKTQLVPDEQIQEVGNKYQLSDSKDSSSCPYCSHFLLNNDRKCDNCPMSLADNNCGTSEENTYCQVISEIGELTGNKLGSIVEFLENSLEFQTLVEKYNSTRIIEEDTKND